MKKSFGVKLAGLIPAYAPSISELPDLVAELMRARWQHNADITALIVGNPVPEAEQLDPELHDRVLAKALRAAERQGITGQAVTPFLLGYLVKHTDGASLEANLAAVRGNVALAAQIARSHAALS